MIEFRRAGMNDSEVLVRLWVDTYTQAYEHVHSKENIRAYCSSNYTVDAAVEILSSDKNSCIIAYRNDLPVGYYVVQHHDCPIEIEGESSELKQIYILSNEYGTGLGMSLFKKASRETRDAGKKWLWLCVSDINYRALSFYKKLGFKSIAAGPTLEVGTDRLSSTIMIYNL